MSGCGGAAKPPASQVVSSPLGPGIAECFTPHGAITHSFGPTAIQRSPQYTWPRVPKLTTTSSEMGWMCGDIASSAAISSVGGAGPGGGGGVSAEWNPALATPYPGQRINRMSPPNPPNFAPL